ncbi:MAG: hypothetical protein IKT57_04790 [Clostridia bacterium]|nr:hypothetical protein [Clostridia bacterium]
MKRWIPLVLALVLALCCAVALAENAEFEVYKNDGQDILSTYNATPADGEDPSLETEVWLRVRAKGQINVTVPLVLVFETNIDGGYAEAPDTYTFKNNSTAELLITEMQVTEAADSNMELVALEEVDADDITEQSLATDTYVARVMTMLDGFTLWFYDLGVAGGKVVPAGNMVAIANLPVGTGTHIPIEMATGPLSFVTKHVNGELDATKGVKLFTVKYTVAIDTRKGVGETITTAAPSGN